MAPPRKKTPLQVLTASVEASKARSASGKVIEAINSLTDRTLADAILELIRQGARANLGLATTRELHDELSARAEMGGYADYRTVDGG